MADLGSTKVYGDINVTKEVKERGLRVFSPNNLNISDLISSSSSTIYASLNAVKTAYDRGTAAYNKALEALKPRRLEPYPIGSVYFCVDAVSPAVKFGGTWVLIQGDASLSFGNGSNLNADVAGDNTPLVPLQHHSHGMNHNHPTARTSTDNHSHKQGSAVRVYPSNSFEYGGVAGRNAVVGTGGAINANQHPWTSSHAHSHTVGIPTHYGTTAAAGDMNARLNVRGARILLNVWRRTA